jgi:hypothetical protein
MSDQYLTFQKFNDEALATELIILLNQHGIKFQVEGDSAFDPTFSGSNDLNKEIRVKIPKHDFEKVDQLLLDISKLHIDTVEKDYYLYEFNDEELIEIITKHDEWSQFDFLLAQKILKDRGKEVNPETVKVIKKQRISELGKPEESQKVWIYLGYISAVLGGLIGIFIGYHLSTSKKILPNGDRVYTHNIPDRKHGKRIFILGIFFFIIWGTIRIITYKFE